MGVNVEVWRRICIQMALIITLALFVLGCLTYFKNSFETYLSTHEIKKHWATEGRGVTLKSFYRQVVFAKNNTDVTGI